MTDGLPLILSNGPVRKELDVNGGWNLPGGQMRLSGGPEAGADERVPGDTGGEDKSTWGRFCIAENANPWEVPRGGMGSRCLSLGTRASRNWVVHGCRTRCATLIMPRAHGRLQGRRIPAKRAGSSHISHMNGSGCPAGPGAANPLVMNCRGPEFNAFGDSGDGKLGTSAPLILINPGVGGGVSGVGRGGGWGGAGDPGEP